jgi:ABC-2 type transport system ATP-binding protein
LPIQPANAASIETGPYVAEIHDVAAGYGQIEVLRGVTLKLRANEIFVLMGPNGSGKTTLIRVILGLMTPLHGEVRLYGDDGRSPLAKSVRLAPQDVALYPFMTARENCVAFAKSSGASWSEARKLADQALELAGCADLSSRKVGQLSGGFRRRANIAAALVGEPRLLVLDEPTVGVDADAKAAIGESLQALKERGLSILIVTHDFDHADALADRAGFLFDGRVVKGGAPRDLLKSAFGTRKRVEIVLSAPPSPLQRERLRLWGATPIRDTVWLTYQDLDGQDAAFLSELRQHRLSVKELRIREPGLGALYARLSSLEP